MMIGRLSLTVTTLKNTLEMAISIAVMAARNVLSLVELLLPWASSKKPDLTFEVDDMLFMGKRFKKSPRALPGDLKGKERSYFTMLVKSAPALYFTIFLGLPAKIWLASEVTTWSAVWAPTQSEGTVTEAVPTLRSAASR